MAFKMFAWVPDGTYDSEYYQVRYVIVDGNPRKVITKMWLDVGGPNDASDDLLVPWGIFPDFPPKPEKK